ncbi:MAG: VOC family protein [Cyanobacteria bacterium J06635_1]
MRRFRPIAYFALAVLAWLVTATSPVGSQVSPPRQLPQAVPTQTAQAQTAQTQPVPTQTAQAQTAQVQEVAMMGMTVSEMDEALAFYTQVLPFEKVSDVEVHGREYEQLQGLFGVRMRVVQLKLGRERIELTEYLTPQGRPIPVDSRSHDLWFQHIAIVVSDMDQAYQQLRSHNVQHVSTGPQRLPEFIEAAAGIEAFYFRDPDDHNLELIYFPPDKGDPRWQAPTDDLFLGIDHTAIAVSDTATSLAFYQDLLGLALVGESENYGTEQEHLNNIFGARLRISGLRASTGPGVEFLEYLSPPGGRPIPDDAQANDLMHWETTLVVADAEAAEARLRSPQVDFVSPGVITLPDTQLGFRRGFLIEDPDGHVLRIVERVRG